MKDYELQEIDGVGWLVPKKKSWFGTVAFFFFYAAFIGLFSYAVIETFFPVIK
jgi:hypothetical protein